MNYLAGDPSPTPEAQQIITHRVDAPLYRVSRRIEQEIPDAEPDGDSCRTVHPDTGSLARSQEYTCGKTAIELTHADAGKDNKYLVDIFIQGSKDEVDALTEDIDSIMNDL